MRLVAAAVFGFRLVALFPVLFAANPLIGSSGLSICTAAGDQTLPVSQQRAVVPLSPAGALAADAQLLPPAETLVPMARVVAFSAVVPPEFALQAKWATGVYHARAPPAAIG